MPGAFYTATVTALSLGGEVASAPTPPFQATGVPYPPPVPTFELGTETATFKWGPSEDSGLPLTNYVVNVVQTAPPKASTAKAVAQKVAPSSSCYSDPADRTCTVTNLQPGATYSAVLSAYNVINNTDAPAVSFVLPAAAVTPTVAPTPVPGLGLAGIALLGAATAAAGAVAARRREKQAQK